MAEPEETPQGGDAPRRRSRPLRALVMLGIAGLGTVAATATMGMTSAVGGPAGPGTVEVRAAVAREGGTEVALPPLGRVVASTHRAPVRLGVRLDEVDIDALQELLAGPRPQQALGAQVIADLPALLRRLVVRSLVAGTLVGATVGAAAGSLVPGRRWPHVVLGALGGLVAVSGVLGWTWRGYDSQAFEEARFEGALEQAPAVLAAVNRQVGELEEVRGLVQVVSGQVAALYAATEVGPPSGQTLILHVSDIHSNPLGLELAQRLAQSFAVDAVLDTGDLTSFGLPFEARISDDISDLGVPYLFVPGNHDSSANRAAIEANPSVVVLDGEVEQVGAVRILGIGDPTFTADNVVGTAEANERKRRSAPSVRATLQRERPDLLAVHDLRQADQAPGVVGVVAAGHTHRRSQQRQGATVTLTVGSTGATGLGSFTVETSQGYEAEILRFDGRRLAAIDYVTVKGITGDFQVERQLIGPAG